ncbi:glycoside hydrolase family 2 TIM barrel-domain containing protein [Amycolatopsis regifaucium]|uniref:beta-galactosidase n=1 Tax=Amycolatopsis regifaucium TaxID=546365 RepID=A0A154MPC2_9PSEU|nr:glycoside hydrolase family 2 TIM barrel-domain containing protein [Amycolatopsis regifaucium]KZB86151.1 glycoside hydrolase [Amycolatopsis regifaucium]OKA05042.1 glycoside hydrolase [Amycolatopsis regifaucium]SFH79937.1 beta-galactosidase [Amycolatopsis regifaucium]
MLRTRPIVAVLAMLAGTLVAAGSAASAEGRPDDVYTYLEDPRKVSEGQEPAHADLRPYADVSAAARRDERGPYTMSLDGKWRIAMADNPARVPAGFHEDGYDASRWRAVSVPHTWQTDGLDHPIFRNIATEIQPDDPPRVPRDVNPTGAYVRDFPLPADWTQRRTFLRFEGVTSAYFVWVNGKYMGYDQGGYTPAEFDISSALRPGPNRIAVQVHRWSAGAYLEDVDQWRYSGIFRSVTLRSTPGTFIQDVGLTTDLDATYTDATLKAAVEVATKPGGTTGKHRVGLSLRDAAGREVGKTSGDVDPGGKTALSLPVRDPAKWTDETPNLYTAVLTLTAPDGRVTHITSEAVGFREIEARDKQLLVNGKRLLFKGVNRAETDPDHGRHVPRRAQERDVALMKQLNINAVRTSHYPSDPYFYELADRHGIWVDDEIDIETHNHENCAKYCQANDPAWRDAFFDRMIGMVERDKNHPSVFLWDTGNEAGLGAHHFALAEWLDANEPTRPIYHQSNNPDGDAPFADVWGPRYPSPEKFAEQAKNTTKPLIFGEYAHAMGNSLGNFREFWDTIRANPQTQGGFIWDWAEQNIRQPIRLTPDSSGNDISAHLTGKTELVEGHRGKALALSGLDDFVEVYRDRKLDITGKALTLDAWVKPGEWTGDFRILGKGDHQYALKMKTRETLEFFIHSGTWQAVQAKVPADFYGNWHRVSGTYDGTALRLYLDGKEIANKPFTGAIDTSSAEVNIGRDFETSWNDPSSIGWMGRGAVDDVRIYDKPLTAAELSGATPVGGAVLALDFDSVTERGSHLSYGSSLSGVDGLIGSDRSVQPETAQMAWAHQPIRFAYEGGTLAVTNERQFKSTDELNLRWRIQEGSRIVAQGERPLRVGAASTGKISLPVPANPADRERFLTVEAVTTQAEPMLARGHILAHDQFSLGGKRIPGLDRSPFDGESVEVVEDTGSVTASAAGVTYKVDKATGTLSSIRHQGKELLSGGPKLDVWRAPISNETFAWGRAEGEDWRKAGLDRLNTTVTGVRVEKDGSRRVRVIVDSRVAAPDVGGAWFDQTMTYTVDKSGTLSLGDKVVPQGSVRTLPYLPRIGVSLAVPDSYDRFAWYGRKAESYVDRKDGTPIGVQSTTVDQQYVDYHRPQDHGNHTDSRWALLTDGRTGGLLVGGAKDVSVTPFDDLDRAAYPFQLRRNKGWFTLHASHAVTGVGDTPNPVRERSQVQQDSTYEYTLSLRPLTSQEARAGLPSGG